MSTKKYRIISFILVASIVLAGCMSTNEDSLNENDIVLSFGEIYSVDKDDIIKNIRITRFPTPIKAPETESTLTPNLIIISDEDAQDLYDCLVDLSISESELENVNQYSRTPEYLIYLPVSKNDKDYGFNIVLGEAYLGLSLVHKEDTLLYKHEISENEYKDLIHIIETKNN